jgi:hypothetical protein
MDEAGKTHRRPTAGGQGGSLCPAVILSECEESLVSSQGDNRDASQVLSTTDQKSA